MAQSREAAHQGGHDGSSSEVSIQRPKAMLNCDDLMPRWTCGKNVNVAIKSCLDLIITPNSSIFKHSFLLPKMVY